MMKLAKIILKNFKLLMRSKISALIIVLGPLFVILLVGLSFNTGEGFNINIGYYSPGYSDLMESFLGKIESESYMLKNYSTSQECIKDIQYGRVHTCIIFPEDLRIENGKTNEIVFYVDQSKINLVYLIRESLASSIYNRSSEISYDLTQNVMTRVFETRTGLTETSIRIRDISGKEGETIIASEAAKTGLANIDLTVKEGPGSAAISQPINNFAYSFESIRDEAKKVAGSATGLIEDLEEYGHLDSNQSAFIKEAKGKLGNASKRIDDVYASSETQRMQIQAALQSIESTMDDMSTKLRAAEATIDNDIIKRIEGIQVAGQSVQADLDSLDIKVNGMITNIDAVKVTDAQNIVSPVTTRIENVLQSASRLKFLFPSILVILIMFIGFLLPSLLIIMEKNSRSFFRVFTTPNSDFLFIAATFITSVILISVQIAVILIFSKHYFNLHDLLSNTRIFSLNLFIIISFFILVGMFIGYLFNTEEMATMFSVSLGAILLLTSGAVFPIESMPRYLIEKVRYNPAAISTDLIRDSIFFNFDFASVKNDVNMLLIYSIAVAALIFIFHKVDKFKFLHHKPGKAYIKKEMLREQFRYGDRFAENIDELIFCLRNLPDDIFAKVVKDKIITDWVRHVANKRYLALRLMSKKDRSEILSMLEEYVLKYRK